MPLLPDSGADDALPDSVPSDDAAALSPLCDSSDRLSPASPEPASGSLAGLLEAGFDCGGGSRGVCPLDGVSEEGVSEAGGVSGSAEVPPELLSPCLL